MLDGAYKKLLEVTPPPITVGKGGGLKQHEIKGFMELAATPALLGVCNKRECLKAVEAGPPLPL